MTTRSTEPGLRQAFRNDNLLEKKLSQVAMLLETAFLVRGRLGLCANWILL